MNKRLDKRGIDLGEHLKVIAIPAKVDPYKIVTPPPLK
jgi:hypothetical protein